MTKHGLDLYQKYESEIYKTANMKHPTTHRGTCENCDLNAPLPSEMTSLEERLNKFFSDYETYLESERRMRVKEFILLARKQAIKDCIEALKLERRHFIGRESEVIDHRNLQSVLLQKHIKGYNQAVSDLESLTKKFLEKEKL